MAWIHQVPEEEAEGKLKRIYDGASKRAGQIYNILRVQSLNPDQLMAGLQLYLATTAGPTSDLSRPMREMLAVVVSQANSCHY